MSSPKNHQTSIQINIGTFKGTPDCTIAPSDYQNGGPKTSECLQNVVPLLVGRRGGRYLLKQTLLRYGNLVVPYSGWHAAERDDETTTTTTTTRQQQQQQFLAVVHPPPHIRTWKT